MKRFLLIAGLGGLLLVGIGIAILMATDVIGAGISAHGFIAMTLGVVLTVALGVGLMALVFYSNSRGHDQRVEDEARRRGSGRDKPEENRE
jgi:membrane-bound ClpP family serine protease